MRQTLNVTLPLAAMLAVVASYFTALVWLPDHQAAGVAVTFAVCLCLVASAIYNEVYHRFREIDDITAVTFITISYCGYVMLVLATANLPKAIMTPCALVGAMLVMLLTFIIDKFLTVTERLWVVRPAILSAVLMGSTSFDRIDDAILALIVGTACYFGWIYSDNIRMFIRGLKLS